MQHLTTGISEQLLGELFAPTSSSHRRLRKTSYSLWLVRTTDNHIKAANDDRQEVVEVVSDAPGELTDSFHPLRLMKRSFGLLAIRSIHQNPGHTDRPSAGVVTYATLGGNPSNLSVATVDATLNLKATALSRLLERLFDCLPIFLDDVGQEMASAPGRLKVFVAEYLIVP